MGWKTVLSASREGRNQRGQEENTEDCRRRGEEWYLHSPHHLRESRLVRTVRVETHEDRVPHRGSNIQLGPQRGWRAFAQSP